MLMTKKYKTMSHYFLHGKLTAKKGHSDQLASILLAASNLVSTAKGCKLYVIGRETTDSNAIWITEIWDSKADHDNSLNVEGVKELIALAMPILEGQPQKGQELEILGGAGI